MNENEMNELRELGAKRAGRIESIIIAGQVEGHILLPQDTKTTKYEHLLPLLAAAEESDETEAVLLLVNTVGGDIEAGLAIAELIASMSKPTASLILGGGHSIGVPLAVSADRSFIVPTSAVTIHPVRLSGVVVGVEQTYTYFSRIQDRIVEFITAHSHISRDILLHYMLATGELAQDVGTVLYGQEAVDCGLIDECGGLSAALRYLHERMGKEKQKQL